VKIGSLFLTSTLLFMALIFFLRYFSYLDSSLIQIIYSLRTHKTSRLGQRYILQSTNLTSYFYKNIY
jgi:hypothetical protein